MNNLIFEKKYRIHTYEADASGKLSIPGLFNYLQDAAARHASILNLGKEHMEKENRFWALARILVKIEHSPDWEEEITVRTWPRGREGLFAIRDFELIGNNGRIYGGASSSWLIVNRDNRRPVRPEIILKELNILDGVKASLDRNPEKLDAIVEASYSSRIFPVRYSDLDINMHVNNVNYIKWVMDTYPLDYILGHRIIFAELNYLHESLPGDEISVMVSESGPDSFNHSIIRKNDDRELCRLKIKWDRIK